MQMRAVVKRQSERWDMNVSKDRLYRLLFGGRAAAAKPKKSADYEADEFNRRERDVVVRLAWGQSPGSSAAAIRARCPFVTMSRRMTSRTIRATKAYPR